MSRVLILGATGLVGSHLLAALLKDDLVKEIILITRRELPKNPKVTQVRASFDELSVNASLFDVDTVFCALGTTIKKAGSQREFRVVDHDYCLMAAILLKEKNPRGHFIIVTAMGADSKSQIFYNKVKGEVEESLKKLKLGALTILRPSLILGARNEQRPLESIGQSFFKAISPLLKRLAPNYAGVEAKKIAMRMHEVAQKSDSGERLILSGEI